MEEKKVTLVIDDAAVKVASVPTYAKTYAAAVLLFALAVYPLHWGFSCFVLAVGLFISTGIMRVDAQDAAQAERRALDPYARRR